MMQAVIDGIAPASRDHPGPRCKSCHRADVPLRRIRRGRWICQNCGAIGPRKRPDRTTPISASQTTRRRRRRERQCQGGPELIIAPNKTAARRRGLQLGNPCEGSGPVRLIVRGGYICDLKRYREIGSPATCAESLVTAPGQAGPGVVHPGVVPSSPRGPIPVNDGKAIG